MSWPIQTGPADEPSNQGPDCGVQVRARFFPDYKLLQKFRFCCLMLFRQNKKILRESNMKPILALMTKFLSIFDEKNFEADLKTSQAAFSILSILVGWKYSNSSWKLCLLVKFEEREATLRWKLFIGLGPGWWWHGLILGTYWIHLKEVMRILQSVFWIKKPTL